MKPVIFLGPSLSLFEARSILDGIYLPPVRQADLLTAIERYHPKVVGIVDGFFSQDLPVWHKEILYAMEQGVRVFGASSMGALRAAELKPFGMKGIGWVFQQYSTGALTEDDEVALSHAPAELGYRKLSEPLVNIRATLETACRAGLIDPEVGDQVIAAAKTIYFPERTIERILHEAAARGLPGNQLDGLETLFTNHYVDAKKNDAVLLLQAIRDLPDPASHVPLPENFERTTLFETLYQRDRAVSHGGTEVRLSAIARYAALHYPGFEQLRFEGLNRKVAALFGRLLGLESQSEQIQQEVRRFRLCNGLSADADFAAWLASNDLSESDFQELMGEISVCRRIQRWWLSTSGRRDQKCKLVLDQLRLARGYEDMALHAARQATEPNDAVNMADAPLLSAVEFKTLIREHAAYTGFHVAMPIDQWAEEVGFASLEDLQMDLLAARAQREGKTASET